MIDQSIERIVLSIALVGLCVPTAQAQVVRSYLGVGHYPPRQHQTYQRSNVNHYRQPKVIRRSVLVNPTVVNGTITDSVLINPTIINNRGDRPNRRYYRRYHRERIDNRSSSGRILIQIEK